MPLDPSIPLQAKTATFDQGAAFSGALANQAQRVKTEDEKLAAANNRLTAIGSLLNSVKDQRSYTMAKQQLAQVGIINPQDIPDEYDPAFVEMHKNTFANAKTQLDKQFKLAEIEQMKAGGATGTLLNRLQAEPALMDTYLGKANAPKGIIVQGGQAGMMPGYNASVASTEGAKKEAEQAAILETAGNIESEKTRGAAAGKSLGEQDKRAINAPNNLMLINEAEKLLPQATSGLMAHGARGIANAFGKSTESSKADRRLNVLSAALTASVPRMEGPQSDKDVAMYKQAAGDVANPDVPYEDRLDALNTMKSLQEKYQGKEEVKVSGEPLDTKAINAAQVGKLSLKDPRVKKALDSGYTPEEIIAHITKGK